MFKKTSEVITAKYMGKGTTSNNPFVRILAKPSRKEQADYNVRGFDWDDSYRIVRPCDCNISADIFDVSSGHHIENFGETDNNYATMFSLFFNEGVLFGNGTSVFYKANHDDIKHVTLPETAFSMNFGVSRNRNIVVNYSDKNRALNVLRGKGWNGFDVYSVKLNLPDEWGAYASIYFSQFLPCPKAFYFFQYQASQGYENNNSIMRIDADDFKITNTVIIKGIQNIAQSPDQSKIAVVTTSELKILDAVNFNEIKKIPLNLPREQNHYVCPPVQFSPCGKYLAYSYSVDGSIIIADSHNLNTVYHIETNGFPGSIFEWSPDGRFLARGYRPRNREASILQIVEIKKQRPIFEIEGVKLNDSGISQSSFPKTFQWHSSYNQFLILMNSGRIHNYQL